MRENLCEEIVGIERNRRHQLIDLLRAQRRRRRRLGRRPCIASGRRQQREGHQDRA
jgi:hypothetical protein